LAGADVDSRYADGATPLMLTGSSDVANCLLDNGADIASEAKKGLTALEQACLHGKLAVVKVLLKRGALQQLQKVSRNGYTPLAVAANTKHEDVTILLLQNLVLQPGFDINHPRLAANQPLLCCAAMHGLCKVAEFALDHDANPNSTGPDGPPFIIAVLSGHNNTVDLLCKQGANVQICFSSLNSLDAAVVRGDARIGRTLIRHGADVNAVTDSEHGSAVLQAAISGKCDIMQLLLDAGATLDAELQYEAVGNCCSNLDDNAAVKVVQLLLPHCSSFTDDNCELGNKMLAHAVFQGKLRVAQLLHAAGADVHRTDQNGNLVHYAAKSGNIAVAKWLQSLGVDARALSDDDQLLPLHYACVHNHMHIANYFLEFPGAASDVHAHSAEKLTPLHYASCNAVDSVAHLLLQRGADANARDIDGVTPLMYASTAAVVKLLLAAGADVTAVDTEQQSALHLQASKGACAGIICRHILLKAGADPTAVDRNGSAAADVADMNEHSTLKTLLSRAADDYCKKQPTVNSTVGDSNSDNNGCITDSSSSVIDLVAKYSDSVVSTVSDCCNSIMTALASSITSDDSEDRATATTSDTIDDNNNSISEAAVKKSNGVCHSAPILQQQQQQQCKHNEATQLCANCSKLTATLCLQQHMSSSTSAMLTK
jgi:ankyrin repeat protein